MIIHIQILDSNLTFKYQIQIWHSNIRFKSDIQFTIVWLDIFNVLVLCYILQYEIMFIFRTVCIPVSTYHMYHFNRCFPVPLVSLRHPCLLCMPVSLYPIVSMYPCIPVSSRIPVSAILLCPLYSRIPLLLYLWIPVSSLYLCFLYPCIPVSNRIYIYLSGIRLAFGLNFILHTNM